MKVLILSCNTGGGHNAAGRALYEEFHRRGIDCEFLDTLSFAGPRASKQASSIYINVTTKTPILFQLAYNIAHWISSPHRKSVVYAFNRKYALKLGQYIEENHFDAVVMPHLFPAEAITHLKKKQNLSARTYAIATDYTCIPFWEETQPDYFFIPHRELSREFIRSGIPREKLVPLGIPVQRTFGVRRDQKEARQALGLPIEGRMVLLMSGSMGYGHLGQMATQLCKEYGTRLSLVILCGNNEKMQEKLKKQLAAYPNIFIVNYTEQVSLYMDAADLLLTKPGGLTSTEAASKKLPLILTDPIPGCETQNASFFERHGLALVPEKKSDYITAVRTLLDDAATRERMQAAQELYVDPTAAAQICGFILADCGYLEPAAQATDTASDTNVAEHSIPADMVSPQTDDQTPN